MQFLPAKWYDPADGEGVLCNSASVTRPFQVAMIRFTIFLQPSAEISARYIPLWPHKIMAAPRFLQRNALFEVFSKTIVPDAARR